MNQKIKVALCCHAPGTTERFVAQIGDVVLIREGNAYVEAAITSIPSTDVVLVSLATGDESSEKEISANRIVALMLGD